MVVLARQSIFMDLGRLWHFPVKSVETSAVRNLFVEEFIWEHAQWFVGGNIIRNRWIYRAVHGSGASPEHFHGLGTTLALLDQIGGNMIGL